METTSKSTELQLLFMMLDPRLKSIACRHKKLLIDKFNRTNLIIDLTKFYESREPITESDLNTLLDTHGIIGTNKEKLIKSFQQVSTMSDSGIELIVSQFTKLISAQMMNQLNNIKDPEKAIEAIRTYNYDFNDPTKLKSKFDEYSLYDLNAKDINNDFGIPIVSSIDAINDCFVIKGYIRHQLVAIVAAPGTGKSLFLMAEATKFVKDGLNVCYVAIGDLTRADFATRCASIVTGQTMSEVTNNLEAGMNKFKNSYGDKLKNFRVIYADASSINSSELCEYLESMGYTKDWVIIVDYDTNFKSDLDMYAKGDESYNNLVNLAKKAELVFIASQPKVNFYDSPIIPMAGAAESSRKAQIVDVMITIGKNPNAVNQIGYINLAKVRRGGRKIAFPYLLNPNGKFVPITSAKYHALEKAPDLKMVKDSGLNNVSEDDLNDLAELMRKSSK